MIDETDALNTVEVMACTAIGESEELGIPGMQQTLNTIMNRAAANLEWMGGSDPRAVCLKPGQYDCWNAGDDRDRILIVAFTNPTYGPYVQALGLAQQALAGNLPDITNGAVSYGDEGEKPEVHPGSQPCLVVGSRVFFNLAAVA